jgi:hypothetical protein
MSDVGIAGGLLASQTDQFPVFHFPLEFSHPGKLFSCLTNQM